MRIKKPVLAFVCFLASAHFLIGQDNKEKIELGLSISTHIVGTDAQFTLGTGQSFGAWMTVPLRENSSLGLALAHRQLNDYYQKEFELKEFIYPSQIHQQTNVSSLMGFSFWDLDVSWMTTLRQQKRWRWGGGIKLAAIDRVRGARSTTILIVQGDLTPTETGPGYDDQPGIIRFASQPLDQDQFAAVDLGGFLKLDYEIVNGVSGTLSYYQGFNNLLGDVIYPGQSIHRVSQFSIGLNARFY